MWVNFILTSLGVVEGAGSDVVLDVGPWDSHGFGSTHWLTSPPPWMKRALRAALYINPTWLAWIKVKRLPSGRRASPTDAATREGGKPAKALRSSGIEPVVKGIPHCIVHLIEGTQGCQGGSRGSRRPHTKPTQLPSPTTSPPKRKGSIETQIL